MGCVSWWLSANDRSYKNVITLVNGRPNGLSAVLLMSTCAYLTSSAWKNCSCSRMDLRLASTAPFHRRRVYLRAAVLHAMPGQVPRPCVVRHDAGLGRQDRCGRGQRRLSRHPHRGMRNCLYTCMYMYYCSLACVHVYCCVSCICMCIAESLVYVYICIA